MSSPYKHVVGGVLKLKSVDTTNSKTEQERLKKMNKNVRKYIQASTPSPVTPSGPSKSSTSKHLAVESTAKEILREGDWSSTTEDTTTETNPSRTMENSQGLLEESRLRRITEAEKSFYLAQKRRQWEKIQKSASKSHKEKVESFNRYLNSLSEHFDIPRVGPG